MKLDRKGRVSNRRRRFAASDDETPANISICELFVEKIFFFLLIFKAQFHKDQRTIQLDILFHLSFIEIFQYGLY